MVSTAHHGSAQNVDHVAHQSSSSHHESVLANDESSTGCPNCLDCVVLCSMTGASVMAPTPLLMDTPINGSDVLIRSAIDFRSSPPPQALFRPPIFQI